MSRREKLTRVALGAGALACLALAVGVGLVATDVLRIPGAISRGDVEYLASAEQTGLWSPSSLAPVDVAGELLGIEDDVALRQAVRALLLARLDDATISDPRLALRRNAAQARLDAIVSDASDLRQRSRAAGLLGVLGLARLVSETQERAAVLASTVANLSLAISLDPGNDEAKYNLELVLQRGRGLQLTEGAGGENPTPGGSGSSGAGAGEPGSGY